MTATTVSGRFSLDTNILVYACDRDAGERHRTGKEILACAAGRDCVLTVQALAEFFHVTTRKGKLTTPIASAIVRDWLELFEVASADDATLPDAMDLVIAHRLAFWDAMLWATARQHGCAAIFSEDMQDGRRLGGLEIINPFAADNLPRVSALLGGGRPR